MQRLEILRLDSPNRAPLVVEGFLWEGGEGPSIAIVGAMSGEAVNPLFVASHLVARLNELDAHGAIHGRILVIPSVNHYALNMGEKFWPLDKTDINMMFPGYDKGETTQRIAHRLFQAIQGYDFGVILEGRSDKAHCLPYIKLNESGYEDLEKARAFGLRYVYHRELAPIETVMLQYNWQLWGTHAFSVVFGDRNRIDAPACDEVKESVIRFMHTHGILSAATPPGYHSNIVRTDDILIIKAARSGIFLPLGEPGAYLAPDQPLARITDALSGETLQTIHAPVHGVLSCRYNHSLIFQNSVAFRIIKHKL